MAELGCIYQVVGLGTGWGAVRRECGVLFGEEQEWSRELGVVKLGRGYVEGSRYVVLMEWVGRMSVVLQCFSVW